MTRGWINSRSQVLIHCSSEVILIRYILIQAGHLLHSYNDDTTSWHRDHDVMIIRTIVTRDSSRIQQHNSSRGPWTLQERRWNSENLPMAISWSFLSSSGRNYSTPGWHNREGKGDKNDENPLHVFGNSHSYELRDPTWRYSLIIPQDPPAPSDKRVITKGTLPGNAPWVW